MKCVVVRAARTPPVEAGLTPGFEIVWEAQAESKSVAITRAEKGTRISITPKAQSTAS
jgi:hypothetical protein